MKRLIERYRFRQRRTLPPPEACCHDDDDEDRLILPSRRCIVIPANPADWFEAITNGLVQRVRDLIPVVDVDVTYYNEDLGVILSGVHLAAMYGDMRILRLLIMARCNVNVKVIPGPGPKKKWIGATPLQFAVTEGYIWAVRSLIHAGCDVNATFRTTLKIGREEKLVEINALYLAAEKGRAMITHELLRHGANANSVSKFASNGAVDTSALHMAVKGRHVEVIRLLLDHGADVTTPDSAQCCPLLWAVLGRSAEVVQMLLKEKPRLDARMTMEGVGHLTSLQLAALKGYELILMLLLMAGARPDDICPLSGKTALHLAAGNGHMGAVRQLVEASATVNILDFSARSALDDANSCNHYDVMKVLGEQMNEGVQKYGVVFQEGGKTSAGVCLIINIKEFLPQHIQNRPTSVHDVEIIQRAFRHLGYKVIVRENLPALQFVEVLREVRQNNIKDMHETFVCCLMSHGDMGTLVGADGESVTLRQLTELLRADLCPQLATKTKIFILESCQGTSEDLYLAPLSDQPESPVTTEARPGNVNPTKIIPEEDFLIWTASLAGNVAYIGAAGSDFIQTIGQRLLAITETPVEFMDVVKDVNKTMAAHRLPKRGPDGGSDPRQPRRQVLLKQVPYVHTTVTSDTHLRQRQRTDS